jgi:hypothetical protein
VNLISDFRKGVHVAKTNISRNGGAIRLTLPAKIANDLGSLQRSLKIVAERLGHPGCATGCDTFFIELEQGFAFNEKAELNPQPLPPKSIGLDHNRNVITVTIPDKVSNNIDTLTQAVSAVVGKLGCSPCCSGFDILFRREINTLAINEKAEVAHFGGLS